MNEDYVSYELAKKLKACGFYEPCNSYYSGNGSIAIREYPQCFNCYTDKKIKPSKAANRALEYGMVAEALNTIEKAKEI